MFDPDGFNLGPWLPPEEDWAPIEDDPPRSFFWPMFAVGFLLAIVII